MTFYPKYITSKLLKSNFDNHWKINIFNSYIEFTKFDAVQWKHNVITYSFSINAFNLIECTCECDYLLMYNLSSFLGYYVNNKEKMDKLYRELQDSEHEMYLMESL